MLFETVLKPSDPISILFNKKANKYDIYLTEEDKKIGQADDLGFVDFIDNVVNK